MGVRLEDLTDQELLDRVKECNPFGGYTLADVKRNRDSIIRTIRRYEA